MRYLSATSSRVGSNNIKSSFHQCGEWPVNSQLLPSVTRPQYKEETETMMGVHSIFEMPERKRNKVQGTITRERVLQRM